MPKKENKKTSSAKKPVDSTQTKPKAPKAKEAKSKAPKASKAGGRGKRYTPAEKAEVLAFVNKVNAEKGRGGAAQAARKFGINQITIGQWVKKAGAPAPAKKKATKRVAKPKAKAATKAVAKAAGDFGAQLRRLADVHDAITRKKAELTSLEEEYAKLKEAL